LFGDRDWWDLALLLVKEAERRLLEKLFDRVMLWTCCSHTPSGGEIG
jgi:hypothetical protein